MTSDPTNIINIFLNSDNNYAVPAYITLYSLMHNYRGEDHVHVYILTPGDLTPQNQFFLKSLSAKYPLLEIFIIDMRDAYGNVSMNSIFPCTILYRLMIPRICEQLHLEIDKCIYLDTDIVVEGDISVLYGIDSDWEEYYCAGVKDPFPFASPNYNDKLGITSLDKYINAGVLLLNLKQIKDDDLKDSLEQAGYRSDFVFYDQDVINSVCYEGIKLIPLKFDVMPSAFFLYNSELCEFYGEENVLEAKRAPLIIHYISTFKPWSRWTSYLTGHWWKYVRMQDKKTMREFITPFIRSYKVPPLTIVKDLLRSALVHAGAYGLYKKARHIFAQLSMIV